MHSVCLDKCVMTCIQHYCIYKIVSLPWQSFRFRHSVVSGLCDHTEWRMPGSSVHRLLQARMLEWVAIPFSRGSSQPRNWTQVSYIAGRFFTTWATREAQFLYSVQSLNRVQLFATPWIAARQASLSITNSRSSLRLTSIESVMPSSHLFLCRPLLLLPTIPPSIRVFSNESTLAWGGQRMNFKLADPLT